MPLVREPLGLGSESASADGHETRAYFSCVPNLQQLNSWHISEERERAGWITRVKGKYPPYPQSDLQPPPNLYWIQRMQCGMAVSDAG